MKIKNKIYMFILACVMGIIGCATFVCANESYDVKETGVIVEGKQKVKVDNQQQDCFYAFTAKKDGIYRFFISVEDYKSSVDYWSPQILSEDGSVMTGDYSFDPELGIKCRLETGQKVYMKTKFALEHLEEADVYIHVDKVATKVRVILADKYGNETNILKDNIEGLSWDADNYTLTLNNYNAPEGVGVKILYDDTNIDEKIYIDVKGKNNFTAGEDVKNHGIEVSEFIDVVMTGDGELNFVSSKEKYSSYGLYVYDSLVINGPRVNLTGAFSSNVIYAHDLMIKSSTIYMDSYPYYFGKESQCGGMVSYNMVIDDGTIICKFENIDEGYQPSDTCSPINVFLKLDAISGYIIYIGDKEAIEIQGKVMADGYHEVTVGSGVKVIKDSKVDINEIGVELLDTKFKYDGKEKKARVKVGGLVEGKDYTVEYKNNINVGKADIIITGIGDFNGTIKITFEIVATNAKSKSSESNKKVNSLVGTTFKDKNFTYKITKEASADGKVKGEVTLISLNNKKIKNVVVKAVVKKNGKKYNVNAIGARAFVKCKKLRKLTIKSTKIKKIGKKAFAKTSKKLVIKVPKKVKKKYAKKLKKVGFKGIVK